MYEVWQTPDVVTAFGTFIAGAAACGGAFIGLVGLTSWKKQAKWQTDRELARSIFVALRIRQDAIHQVRSPVSWSDKNEIKDNSATDEQREWRRIERELQERWDKLVKVRTSFHPLELEGDAIWGVHFVSLCEKINSLERELYLAILLHVESHDPDNSEHSIFDSREAKTLNRRVIYASGTKDEFGSKYDEAAADLENFLRNKLEHSRP